MPLIHLDTNALIALADPAQRIVAFVRERVVSGTLPETSSVAWHEFVRGPLSSDETSHYYTTVREGQPQLRIAFTKWNLTPPATDFTFTPPAGTQQIEMWTTAKMQATQKP